METALGAASWFVGKALEKLSGDLLEAWAASTELGANIRDIKSELLYARGILHNAHGRDIDNPALAGLLQQLSQLAHDAEDLLDEVDYFRIQDVLRHTKETVEEAGGCFSNLAFHSHLTARAVRKRISCFSCGDHRLKFDRVDVSTRMKCMVQQFHPICDKVSTVLSLELMRSPGSRTKLAVSHRPITTSRMVAEKMFGRDDVKKQIIDELTSEKYQDKEMSVIPIVGSGGIGKTSLVQSIYNDNRVTDHFHVKIWICVSLNFSVQRLTSEILKGIPKVKDEQNNDEQNNKNTNVKEPNLDQAQEQIEKRLESKKILLVLDDMWECKEDDWKTLCVTFRKGSGEKGNMILVTTRFQSLANIVRTTNFIDLTGLKDDALQRFFLACVFGDEQWKDDEALLNIGKEIMNKLKGSPLAINTVGRLLRNNLSCEHWSRVLDSKEWEFQKDDSDIMPALKLSYDYLPFHLQQCFSFCALFPDNYQFEREELINFWIGLGIIECNSQRKRVEDTGSEYLNDLVDHGFFKKEERNEDSYYVLHDLHHDLARMVSSKECLVIDRLGSRSREAPPSIRHLSIITRYEEFDDEITCEENFKKEVDQLKKELRIENLSTLLLIGSYDSGFAEIFKEVFRETKGLRVVYLSTVSYNIEFLLPNFPKLLHLRYLRLESIYGSDAPLPKALSGFYHLKILDLRNFIGSVDLPRNMNNLINLRHFLAEESLHPKIVGVGKMKLLQELKRFDVNKDTSGFELHQLGELMELGGSLSIRSLENIKNKEEAEQAKLMHKRRLHKLELAWDSEQSISGHQVEEEILESLQPPPYLRELSIKGHGGSNCPKWLHSTISVNNLESLSLYSVKWKDFSPLGQLRELKKLKLESISVVVESGMVLFGSHIEQSFPKLKEVVLIDMPEFKKWTGNNMGDLFSCLEVLEIHKCPKLKELPFSHFPSFMQGGNLKWFSTLRVLKIKNCPQLMTLPPMPCPPTLLEVDIEDVGLQLNYFDYSTEGSKLQLSMKESNDLQKLDGKVLAFHNLNALRQLYIHSCPPLSWECLQTLTSLKSLSFHSCRNGLISSDWAMIMTPMMMAATKEQQLLIEELDISGRGFTGNELSQLLFRLPALSDLWIYDAEQLSSIVTDCSAVLTSEEEEEEEEEEGLVWFPAHLSSSIRKLAIYNCPNLCFSPPRAGSGRGGGLFQGLHSLESLTLGKCPKLMSSTMCIDLPFPPSLRELRLRGIPSGSMETLHPLSNLTSLTTLCIWNCPDLRGEGLKHLLLTNNNLKDLAIWRCPIFFSTREEEQQKEASSSSSSSSSSCSLEYIMTDDTRILSTSICTHLSTSLHTLEFRNDEVVECLTEEQESALQLLTKLLELQFLFCENLWSLPARLHTLPSLKELSFVNCPLINSLPKEGLPTSLQNLVVSGCSKQLNKQCGKLKGINTHLSED